MNYFRVAMVKSALHKIVFVTGIVLFTCFINACNDSERDEDVSLSSAAAAMKVNRAISAVILEAHPLFYTNDYVVDGSLNLSFPRSNLNCIDSLTESWDQGTYPYELFIQYVQGSSSCSGFNGQGGIIPEGGSIRVNATNPYRVGSTFTVELKQLALAKSLLSGLMKFKVERLGAIPRLDISIQNLNVLGDTSDITFNGNATLDWTAGDVNNAPASDKFALTIEGEATTKRGAEFRISTLKTFELYYYCEQLTDGEIAVFSDGKEPRFVAYNDVCSGQAEVTIAGRSYSVLFE